MPLVPLAQHLGNALASVSHPWEVAHRIIEDRDQNTQARVRSRPCLATQGFLPHAPLVLRLHPQMSLPGVKTAWSRSIGAPSACPPFECNEPSQPRPLVPLVLSGSARSSLLLYMPSDALLGSSLKPFQKPPISLLLYFVSLAFGAPVSRLRLASLQVSTFPIPSQERHHFAFLKLRLVTRATSNPRLEPNGQLPVI